MIGHQQQVKKICYNGGDWRGYDEAYRRGAADATLGWGQMNSGLILDAMVFKGVQGPRDRQEPVKKGTFRGSSGTFIRQGYCFGKHKTGRCDRSGCPWKHSCPECGSDHAFTECNGNRGQKRVRPGHAGQTKK